MKAFWNFIATQAVKLAVYASEHPDQVIAFVQKLKRKKAEQP